MLPRRVEALPEQLPELAVRGTVEPSENFDVFERELERRSLETNVPWGVGEHEAKVDVDEVPIAVEEDVAVVPVLDLQEVRDERVARERLGEVALRAGVLCRSWVAVRLWH